VLCGTEFASDLGDALAALISFGGSLGLQIVCAVAAAAILTYKGRSWIGGAFLGFFLGPFGVLIALAMGGWPGKSRPTSVPPTSTHSTAGNSIPAPPARRVEYLLPSQCPHCSGPVHRRRLQSNPVRCFYCGSPIEATPVRPV
jgi:hypothetical protein